MNTLKVRGLLGERYPSHFLDLIDKLTKPVFATPCSYSNTVMRSPLKEKIQNAINRAINDNNIPYNDYNNNGDGALMVGGRRRNRKKKNKKNGQKKKKNSIHDIKAKLSPSGVRKGGPDQENAPLIDQEAEEDKENTNKVKMPLFKKKAAPAAPQDPAVASTPNDATTGATDPNAGTTDPNAAATNPNAGNTDPNAGNTDPNAGNTDPNAGNADPNAGAKDVTKTPADAGAPVTAAADQNKSSANGGVTTDAKKSDAADPSVNVDSSKGDAKFSTDSKDPGSDVTQGTGTKKSEKSPLITDHTGPPPKISQSKFKDQAPGFLCCAIL